jgi:hypothetical protein
MRESLTERGFERFAGIAIFLVLGMGMLVVGVLCSALLHAARGFISGLGLLLDRHKALERHLPKSIATIWLCPSPKISCNVEAAVETARAGAIRR